MLVKHAVALICAALMAGPPMLARAAPDTVSASILAGWRMEDGTRIAALRLELAPGWKTYWRAPGEAGIPPRLDWRGSRNVDAVEILWPTPEQTITNGMRTIGYAQDVVLPVRIWPARADAPVTLSADLEIGVCRDICMPVSLRVARDLPPDGGAAGRDPRIAAALAARPHTAAEAGVGRVLCRVAPIEGGMELVAEIEMAQMGARELVVVESGDPALWVAQAETARKGDRVRVRTEIYHVDGKGFALDRSALRFTVLSAGDAVDIRGCTGR